MKQFIAQHQPHISGVLSGFDRLVMRGTLRRIAHTEGMNHYLWANNVLLKDFATHVESVSQALKSASVAETLAAGRPVRYLYSPDVSKEDIARRIAAEDHVTNGPVCALTCVEPCWSFQIYRDRDTKTTPAPAVSPQVPVHLPLSDPSRVRLPQCAHSNVVSLPHPDLPERTGMVGAPDGPVGDGLRTPGQLFPVGRRLAAGATPARRATSR